MSGDIDRPPGEVDGDVDLDELGTGSGAPEAVTEQPDLSFERNLEARWLGDVMGMRIAALALVRRARRRRGEEVLPLPWSVIVGAGATVAAIIATIAWIARVVAG